MEKENKKKSIRLKACQTSNYCVVQIHANMLSMHPIHVHTRTHVQFLFFPLMPFNTILIIITETKYDKKIYARKTVPYYVIRTYTHTYTILQHHCKDFSLLFVSIRTYKCVFTYKKGRKKNYLPKKGTHAFILHSFVQI